MHCTICALCTICKPSTVCTMCTLYLVPTIPNLINVTTNIGHRHGDDSGLHESADRNSTIFLKRCCVPRLSNCLKINRIPLTNCGNTPFWSNDMFGRMCRFFERANPTTSLFSPKPCSEHQRI